MIYLDHAATTPLRPEAIAATEPFRRGEVFGNASGVHAVARRAKTALEEARDVLGRALGADPGDVVFTSGGTEADNLAVRGAARAARARGLGDGIVATAFEHKAVLESCDRLAHDGFRVRYAPVGRDGVVDLDHLADLLDERTVLVSTMLVNNEVGTVQPLADVVALARDRAPRAVVHTDAVQAVPWLPVEAATATADLVSVSAHKFGGPKGIGALVARDAVPLEPILVGGGQERGARSGTSNVAGAVGMAAALEATVRTRDETTNRIRALRDRFVDGARAAIPNAFVSGDPVRKIAGNAHLGFPGVEVETLLLLLDQQGVCAAAGSACQSGSLDPSHVLLAMGFDRRAALSSVRFSFGWTSTDADVDGALEVLPAAVQQLRAVRR